MLPTSPLLLNEVPNCIKVAGDPLLAIVPSITDLLLSMPDGIPILICLPFKYTEFASKRLPKPSDPGLLVLYRTELSEFVPTEKT